ncbi:NAD(P)-dependent dehydrogenase (short-subunit alcohol dehydrogenase family) [Chitinophaga skermanii]|uniref:NAD(P)-dependent dehydrogenase (Short-subunit alcohol dehydrogenase family) n=1 Tax=Chitinophaga skermanii TaxID=331697 RepID=A0A327QXD2_9BACT|nr:SDR family oxidoreductase [Chitinophaga skermanii]RAJ08458.1 NAD(P)-dependent dehydrogenase (short-subunit alcohol dehydrogenase family) [Chitinophaga skermanii]
MDTFQQRNNLSGKRVIVLGASSGIGLATAKAAAASGAKVVIVSGNPTRLENALNELPKGSEGYTVDLSQEANIHRFFSTIGQFDHLVYTAAENLELHNLSNTDLKAAQSFFTLRYWSALAAVKYATPHINPGGSINLMGGIAGARPGAGWFLAASMCGAIEAFCRAMAVELSPIRVNAVAAGVIKTNLWNSMPETERAAFYTNVGNSLLLKRVGEAEEIAQTFVFLMQQTFATGQTFVIDGGAVLV